jgi:hypothetical protein
LLLQCLRRSQRTLPRRLLVFHGPPQSRRQTEVPVGATRALYIEGIDAAERVSDLSTTAQLATVVPASAPSCIVDILGGGPSCFPYPLKRDEPSAARRAVETIARLSRTRHARTTARPQGWFPVRLTYLFTLWRTFRCQDATRVITWCEETEQLRRRWHPGRRQNSA